MTAVASHVGTVSLVLSNLAVVPLALHYLSFREFGFWSFTTQSIGYLVLLDFGVSAALGRLIAGALKDRDVEEANRWFTASAALLAGHAAGILLLGFMVSGPVLEWIRVPSEMAHTAHRVWVATLAVMLLHLLTKIFSSILYAENRHYWNGFAVAAGAWAGLFAFYIAARAGGGLWAYVWSLAAQLLLNTGVTLAALRVGLYRPAWVLAGIRWTRLRRLYGYSAALFLNQAANLMILSGPTLIVTKLLGLEAAAGFNTSSRVILTTRTFVWQFFDSYLPGWQQQFLKGNYRAVLEAWRLRFDLAMGLAGLAGALVVALNPWFVGWWAAPELHQGFGFDCAGAVFCLTTMLIWGIGFPPVFALEFWCRALLHLLAAVFAVSLGIWWTGVGGVQGPFWAASAGYVLALGLYNSLSFRRLLVRPAGGMARAPWRFPLFLGPIAAMLLLAEWRGLLRQPSNWMIAGLAVAWFAALWGRELTSLWRRRPEAAA